MPAFVSTVTGNQTVIEMRNTAAQNVLGNMRKTMGIHARVGTGPMYLTIGLSQ